VRAVQLNAADPRALAHLEELVANHDEVKAEIPDILVQVEKCRVAVEQAGLVRRKFEQDLNQRMGAEEQEETD
jgi:hypothetical protein